MPIYDEQLKLLCLENSVRSMTLGSSETAKMWQLMSISLGDLNSEKKTLWSKHPLGWSLAQKVIGHFE
jgi:hypothetical protein